MDISSSTSDTPIHIQTRDTDRPNRTARRQGFPPHGRILGPFLRFLLLLSLLLVTACNAGPAREANGVKWLTNEEAGTMPEDTVCLVSGEPSKTGFAVSYKGKTYFLCCKKCVRAFQAEPDRYAEEGAVPDSHEHGP